MFHGGRLLSAVQRSGQFVDSKTFVDCPARGSAAQVLAAYDEASAVSGDACLPAFLAAHFDAPVTELQLCSPPDWSEQLGWAAELPSEEARSLAARLHALWCSLCRRTAPSLAGCSTLLALPHPCFVPGDRFREV